MINLIAGKSKKKKERKRERKRAKKKVREREELQPFKSLSEISNHGEEE